MGNCVCYYQQTRPWYFNLFTKSASCSLLKETHFLCLYFSFSSWKFASSIIKRQKIETGICFLSLTFRSAFFWFLLLIFPFFSKRSIIPVVLFSTNPWSGYHWYNCRSVYQLAWENSRHWSRDATTTQSFPRNDVRETSFQHSISITGQSLPRSSKCFWLVENWK